VASLEAPDAASLLGRPEALRAGLERCGYLLLRGLLDRRALEPARSAIRTVLAEEGWLEPTSGCVALAAAPGPREARRLYLRCYVQPAVHELPHHPRLLELMAALLEVERDALLVHPKPACRIVLPAALPGADRPTPAHQDHANLQGCPATLTAWIPLVDCPPRLGPLAFAEGSHRGGLRAHRALPGARVLACEEAPIAGTFVTASCRVGDVVVFHGLTVHKALANASGQIRLSIDCRYQRAGDPICEAALREDPDLPWDELSRCLGDDRWHRYWEGLPLEVVPFDPGFARPPEGG